MVSWLKWSNEAMRLARMSFHARNGKAEIESGGNKACFTRDKGWIQVGGRISSLAKLGDGDFGHGDSARLRVSRWS